MLSESEDIVRELERRRKRRERLRRRQEEVGGGAGAGVGDGTERPRPPGCLLPSSAAAAGLREQRLCPGTGNASALRGLPCVCLRSAVLPGACGCGSRSPKRVGQQLLGSRKLFPVILP